VLVRIPFPWSSLVNLVLDKFFFFPGGMGRGAVFISMAQLNCHEFEWLSTRLYTTTVRPLLQAQPSIKQTPKTVNIPPTNAMLPYCLPACIVEGLTFHDDSGHVENGEYSVPPYRCGNERAWSRSLRRHSITPQSQRRRAICETFPGVGCWL